MLKNDNSAKTLEFESLGEKLRLRRKEMGLTLSDVADWAGLSVGFISQVERNITAPSLGSLTTIAGALKLPVNVFLTNPTGNEEVTRSVNRSVFGVPGHEVSYERISSSFAGSTIHSVIIHEPPGHRIEPISHEGEEMFFILSGEITVEIEGERSILNQGDSLHFNSRRTHSIWNHSDKPTSILWCGTMDVFGGENHQPIHKHNDNKDPNILKHGDEILL